MSPAAVPVWARVGDCERSRRVTPAPASPLQALARPKSRTLTLPSGVTLTFAGLRSRWTMPFSCASSRASAICPRSRSPRRRGIGPALQALGEVLALDELHGEEVGRRPVVEARALEAVEVGDVRVVERGEHLRLALEAGEPLGVRGEGLGQELERDVAAELRVGRAVDLAHAARAERGGDPVLRERLADQGQDSPSFGRTEDWG